MIPGPQGWIWELSADRREVNVKREFTDRRVLSARKSFILFLFFWVLTPIPRASLQCQTIEFFDAPNATETFPVTISPAGEVAGWFRDKDLGKSRGLFVSSLQRARVHTREASI